MLIPDGTNRTKAKARSAHSNVVGRTNGWFVKNDVFGIVSQEIEAAISRVF